MPLAAGRERTKTTTEGGLKFDAVQTWAAFQRGDFSTWGNRGDGPSIG